MWCVMSVVVMISVMGGLASGWIMSVGMMIDVMEGLTPGWIMSVVVTIGIMEGLAPGWIMSGCDGGRSVGGSTLPGSCLLLQLWTSCKRRYSGWVMSGSVTKDIILSFSKEPHVKLCSYEIAVYSLLWKGRYFFLQKVFFFLISFPFKWSFLNLNALRSFVVNIGGLLCALSFCCCCCCCCCCCVYVCVCVWMLVVIFVWDPSCTD